MMNLKRFLSTLLCASLVGILSAQSTLNGRVTDEQGQPLPSATVMTASGKGVFTDLDGKYTLNVASGEQRITFSFIGFLNAVKKVDLKPGETQTLNVRLQEDAVCSTSPLSLGTVCNAKKK